jgi:hypothetical protein
VSEGQVIPIRKLEECWLDKRHLAEYLDCSPRWVIARYEEGMPCKMIAGRLKFKVSEAEPWLEEHGHIEERNRVA